MTSRTPTVPALPGQASAGSRNRRGGPGVGFAGWIAGRRRGGSGRRGLAVGDQLETATYLEFLYGFGAAPGVDLGAAMAYSRVATPVGATVYRQEFERGLTIANLGTQAAEIVLDRPYYTRQDDIVTSLTMAAHSAEVLFNDPA